MLSKNETVSLGEIDRLVAGQHHDPHSVLGAHPEPGEGVTIRALRPHATSIVVVLLSTSMEASVGFTKMSRNLLSNSSVVDAGLSTSLYES